MTSNLALVSADSAEDTILCSWIEKEGVPTSSGYPAISHLIDSAHARPSREPGCLATLEHRHRADNDGPYVLDGRRSDPLSFDLRQFVENGNPFVEVGSMFRSDGPPRG